jgi:hypothetical protein
MTDQDFDILEDAIIFQEKFHIIHFSRFIYNVKWGIHLIFTMSFVIFMGINM